jgi:hypothetical protein
LHTRVSLFAAAERFIVVHATEAKHPAPDVRCDGLGRRDADQLGADQPLGRRVLAALIEGERDDRRVSSWKACRSLSTLRGVMAVRRGGFGQSAGVDVGVGG